MTKQANIRSFNQCDWYGYAGAERFADGSEPLITELNDETQVVADKNGIGVFYWAEETEDNIDLFLTIPNLTAKMAKALLTGLPLMDDQDALIAELREMGFSDC